MIGCTPENPLKNNDFQKPMHVCNDFQAKSWRIFAPMDDTLTGGLGERSLDLLGYQRNWRTDWDGISGYVREKPDVHASQRSRPHFIEHWRP